MISTSSLQIFVAVVEAGSFSTAARKLGLAASSVSRQITQLEQELQALLFIRTTRTLSLTEAGEIFNTRAQRILADLAEAGQAVRDFDQSPTGVLRISAPTVLGRLHVVPTLARYLQRWPEVTAEVQLSDSIVDIIGGGIDVAVRIATLDDSSTLVARKLAPINRRVYASPAYIERFGQPLHPEDLQSHNCLTFEFEQVSSLWRAGAKIWRFQGEDGLHEIPVSGAIKANSSDVLVRAAMAGLGIILLVDWIVADRVEEGSLVPLLDNYIAAPSDGDVAVYAVYPGGRRAPAKVKMFVDELQQYFATTEM
jgi:DNA-binding transcriptional LysR family regulator